ncbi:MAG: cyclic nucleotide-binding domain-containing protein [Actinobacteria bacterium]|nr:cyclic nucleotide-binding domain-containing protein [Actinomycetota bacterium]
MAGEPSSAPRITHSLVTALRSVRDLSTLDEESLLDIVGTSSNLFWPAGAAVFGKGEPSDALYIVLSGRVRIFDPDGGQGEVDRVGPGESFGELSLLLQAAHSLSAQAIEDAEIMVVPRGAFEELLSENRELADHFRKRLEERRPVRGDVSG